MQNLRSLKPLIVMLFAIVSMAGKGAVVESISGQTINSSNSVVITDHALLGTHVVLTTQQNQLYLLVVNTATDQKKERTLVRYNASVSKHGVVIHGTTKDNEDIHIQVNEVKGEDYLICIISSERSNEPFDISFKSEEIGFGNNLQNINYYKSFEQEMNLIGSAKNSLKYLKQWINKIL